MLIIKFKKKVNTFLNRIFKKNNQLKTIISLQKRIKILETSQSNTETYISNILRIVPANIYWKDLNGIILGGNLSHAKLAGFSDTTEVIGKTDHDFVWRDSTDEIMKCDRLIMESGVGCQLEEVGTLADGKVHTFLTCKDPLLDNNNKVIGIIGVSTDITALKELQEELLQTKTFAAEAEISASNAKATAEEKMRKIIMILVGDIVHDLRTPLTTIQIITGLLETTLPIFFEIIEEAKSLGATKINLLNQNNWDYLLKMTPITDLQKSVTMINDFINITLAELASVHNAASSELTRGELRKNSSRRIIDNTLQAYPFSESERSKIKQNINYDFDFMGNAILIMKLLFNLIKNALEQIALNSDEGEIIISTEAGGDYNLIKIKDTAGGAAPEIMSNLFNGYFTTKKNGTGIGLAFCKTTMTSFGGDIECNSVYGESMEFILKFPV